MLHCYNYSIIHAYSPVDLAFVMSTLYRTGLAAARHSCSGLISSDSMCKGARAAARPGVVQGSMAYPQAALRAFDRRLLAFCCNNKEEKLGTS